MTTEVPGAAVPAVAEDADSSRFYFGYYMVGAALIAQFVAVGSQNYIVGVFFRPMTMDLDWSRTEFTVARTVGQVGMALIGLFIGAYVDRAGGRRIMTVGIVILGAALYSLSYVQELWQWILLNGIVLTIGAAMIGNLVVNITLSKWFVEQRGRVVGFSAMGVSLAGVVLPRLMTEVVEEWGWRAGWRVAAIGSMALVIPVTFFMRRAPEDYGLHPDGKTNAQMAAGGGARAAADYANSLTRAQAVRTPVFYLLVVAFGMFAVSIGVMLLQTIPFMEDAGYDEGTAALMITVASVPALLAKPLWGAFIDRTEPNKLTSFSSALTGVAILLIVFSVHNDIKWLVYVAFFLLGGGWGGLIPLQEVTWATYFGRRHIGAVRSAGLPFSIALGASGPLLAAFYYDHVGNYDGAFIIVAGSCLIASVLILFAKYPARPVVAST
jgi:sugar phosphate permease